MNSSKSDKIFLFFSFGGPLSILLLPAIGEYEKEKAKTILEGVVFFLISVLIVIMFRLFSFLPIVGVIFYALSFLFSFFYLIMSGYFIYKKTDAIEYEIPFLSFYAGYFLR